MGDVQEAIECVRNAIEGNRMLVGTDVAVLLAEHDRLRVELDEAQLRSIEARNPGIDMDDVRARRAGGRS